MSAHYSKNKGGIPRRSRGGPLSSDKRSAFCTPAGSNRVEIRRISKAYRAESSNEEPIEVLKRFSLEIPDGQFVAICGPNGCGKSTLLSAVAGITQLDEGEITVGGRAVHEVRKAFVFQNYRDSLLPWRTIADNITMPLELAGVTRRRRNDRLVAFVDEFKIAIPEGRYPYQLSGGEQQRLCMLRALIVNPDVLLMDEALSALDRQTREDLQITLQNLWLRRRSTTLYVSHDVRESLFLADRLVLLSRRPTSVIADLKVPLERPRTLELFEDPKSPFWKLEAEATRIMNREVRSQL